MVPLLPRRPQVLQTLPLFRPTWIDYSALDAKVGMCASWLLCLCFDVCRYTLTTPMHNLVGHLCNPHG